MKTLILSIVLSSFALAADAKKEEQPVKQQPVTLSKPVETVKVMPDDKLELVGKASWEDAAYALLNTAKQLEISARSCYKQLEEKKEVKKK